MEQGCSEKLVRQKVVSSYARKHIRMELFKHMKDSRNDNKLVFNIAYHLNVSILKYNVIATIGF